MRTTCRLGFCPVYTFNGWYARQKMQPRERYRSDGGGEGGGCSQRSLFSIILTTGRKVGWGGGADVLKPEQRRIIGQAYCLHKLSSPG
jgi:hypothetical protein